MEKEQIVKALAHWAKNFDGKLTDFKTLCESLTLILEQEKRIEELEAENEKLKKPRYMVCSDGRIEMIPSVESVRNETVRKMHDSIKERCIKGGIYPAFVASTIDKVAKELLEEGKKNANDT